MNDPDQLSLFEEASPEEASPLAIEVPVLEVFDGDGFRTKIALCQLTGNPKDYSEREAIIRCAFIDAPELEQRGGSEAREFLTALIGGRKVWIDIRMKMDTGKSVDQHGRIVAWDHGAAAWSRRRNRSGKGMTPVRQLHLFRGRRHRTAGADRIRPAGLPGGRDPARARSAMALLGGCSSAAATRKST